MAAISDKALLKATTNEKFNGGNELEEGSWGGVGGSGGGNSGNFWQSIWSKVPENGVGFFSGFNSNAGNYKGNAGTWFSYSYSINNGQYGGFGNVSTMGEVIVGNIFVRDVKGVRDNGGGADRYAGMGGFGRIMQTGGNPSWLPSWLQSEGDIDPLRGGSQKIRDREIKQYPKDFQRWYHREWKPDVHPGRDGTPEEIKDGWDTWNDWGSHR